MRVDRYQPRFKGFHDLIKFRVREILLVSTLYDAFVLEEDRNLSERLFGEYLELDLRFVPRITRVSTGQEALKLRKRHFNMIICMMRLPDMSASQFRDRLRTIHPRKPLFFLTYDALDESFLKKLRANGHERVFYYHRDTNILVSIVKQAEDLRNVSRDTRAGVQVVLLVEDSPRFYSVFLPLLYTEILTQQASLIPDSANALHRMLRMRARPKILLAESLEAAQAYFRKYKHNIIGVISDVRFPIRGEKVADAGLRFARYVRERNPDMPFLLQSSEIDNEARAEELGLGFLFKGSQTLAQDLREHILHSFGFGDFVFRTPEGAEVSRASSLHELHRQLQVVPDEVLEYHARRNHISTWLRARAEFEAAEDLRPKRFNDYRSHDEVRLAISASIKRLGTRTRKGMVLDFVDGSGLSEHAFVKLGSGSLGGKGRGLAFINSLLARDQFCEDVEIRIPRTLALCTDLFERFMEDNDLYEWAREERTDQEIAARFLEAMLPAEIGQKILVLLKSLKTPLAVRSSSLLEDNQILPFAGIYKTFMLPNNHPDLFMRHRQLSSAIKLVYASMFFREPREYIRNTGYRLEEERMGVIIQEIVGSTHGDLHYPTLSGVARSYNYYPFQGVTPEEGSCSLALGLGKAIVESQKVFHFCPAHPRLNPPFSTDEDFLSTTQTTFWALDVSDRGVDPSADEGFSLREEPLSVAEAHGSLAHLASTWSPQDQRIRDYLMPGGPRILRFAQILKYNSVPIPETVRVLLEVGRESFGSPVEIEFSVDIDERHPERSVFHFLQIRPMILNEHSGEIPVEALTDERTLCGSPQAMGNGAIEELRDIVYVRPEAFHVLKTREIAWEVSQMNRRLREEGRGYVLIGFGRWGTSDPFLGIPVTWDQISGAKLFIESDRADLWVEPSQGSHFFQNMLSLRLGYFFVKEGRRNTRLDWEWLDQQEATEETTYLRHLRFDEPLRIEIDGRTSRGRLWKP